MFASGLSYPQGLAFDSAGNLFVADNGGQIDEFNTNGVGTVFASTQYSPIGLAFDKDENLYVVIQSNNSIEEFNTNGVGTVFASSTVNYTDYADGLAFDENGNLYVANSGNGTIEEFDTNGVGTVFASGLNSPQGLAFDSAGNLYVANYGNGTIEEFDTNGVGTTFVSGLDEPISIAIISTAIYIPRLTITLLGDNPLTNECHTTFTDPGRRSVGRRNRFEQQHHREWHGKRQGARYVHPDLHCHKCVMPGCPGDTLSYCGGAHTARHQLPGQHCGECGFTKRCDCEFCAHRDR